MKGRDYVTLLWVVILVTVLGFSAWAHFDGPCGLYKYSKAGEVPARCVMKK